MPVHARPAGPRDLDAADDVLEALGRGTIRPSQELTAVEDDPTEVDQRTRFGRPPGSLRVPDPKRRAGIRRPTPRSMPATMDVTHPVSPTLSPAVAALGRDSASFGATVPSSEAVPETGHFRSSTGSLSDRSTVPPVPPGRSGWSLPTSRVLRTRELKRRVRRGLAVAVAAGLATVGFRLLLPSEQVPVNDPAPISAARAHQFAPPVEVAAATRVNVPTVPVTAEAAAPPALAPDAPSTEPAIVPAAAPAIAPAEPAIARPELAIAHLEPAAAPVPARAVAAEPAAVAGRPSAPARQRSAGQRRTVERESSRQGIAAVVALNEDALTAYEELDLRAALELLQRAVRVCEAEGPRANPSLATTHLHLGIVLAAGFKQRALAAKHFRLANDLRPGIAPLPSQMSPDVLASLRLARGVPLAQVEELGGSDDPLAGAP